MQRWAPRAEALRAGAALEAAVTRSPWGAPKPTLSPTPQLLLLGDMLARRDRVTRTGGDRGRNELWHTGPAATLAASARL